MENKHCPTVFHVTHWKAGSQWVRSILKLAAPDRFIEPEIFPQCLAGASPVQGAVYSPLYCPRSEFRRVIRDHPSNRTFVVIRDPRDTLVSWYFSLMYSHRTDKPTICESREKLRGLNKAEGLACMIEKHMRGVMLIQREWFGANGIPIFRYEDLWTNQQGVFEKIFNYCELDVSTLRRRYLVHRQSFALRTFWRLGRPNPRSHFRQGTPGDWKNHFTDDVKRLFKSNYGPMLVQAGYERDDNW